LNAHRESNLEERVAALEAVIAQPPPVQSLVADQGIKEISVPPPVHKAIPACLFHMSLVLNDLMPQPLAETEVWRVLPFEGGKFGVCC